MEVPADPADIFLAVSQNCKPGRFVATASYSDTPLHRDTINLNSSRSRNQFINGTIEALPDLNGRAEEFRQNLAARLLAYAAVPPGVAEPPLTATDTPADPRAEAFAKMPHVIRSEAEALLCDRNLLDRVGEDIERLGVVGESLNRLTIYLIGTSAQLARPLAAIGRGASSSGKSFLCERVSQLFPPEVVLNATSLTTNALYYFPPGTLRHRFVVAGERSRVEDDERAEATRALREMIEGGRLSKGVPVKEGDRMVTRLIEQEGPIAYVETTTRNAIFDEDANRCLLLNTDESVEQTQRIIKATAAAAAGRGCADVDRVCQLHHAMQRMIPRVEVVVPFAEAIGRHYPAKRLESRRDFRHLLQLVRASALLHFRQRERGPTGEVVATFGDYAAAERLARVPLGTAACGISEATRQFLDQLRTKFGERVFTTTEAKTLPGASGRTVADRLHELNRASALEQTAPSKGQVPAAWKLTGTNPMAGEGVLPTLEQVMDAYSDCQHTGNA